MPDWGRNGAEVCGSRIENGYGAHQPLRFGDFDSMTSIRCVFPAAGLTGKLSFSENKIAAQIGSFD